MSKRGLPLAPLFVLATGVGCGSGDDASGPPDISIQQTTLPVATVGAPYDAVLGLVEVGVPEVTWRVASGTLPAGLELTGSGRTAHIRGTPTQVGTAALTISAATSDGRSDTIDLDLEVVVGFEITTALLPDARRGERYTETIATAGGTAVSWTVASGELPPGLAVSAVDATNGQVDGVPTTAGDFEFELTAEDSGGRSASRSFAIRVEAIRLAIDTTTLNAGAVDTPYTATLVASGGTASGYAWTIASGALPDGLVLAADGTPSTTVSGSPTVAGEYTFAVEVRDSAGERVQRTFALVIEQDLPPLVFPQPANLPSATIGLAYSTTLTASGGVGDYTWSVVSDALPAGLTLAASGTPSTQVSGTPELSGDFAFTVRVTDSAQQTAERRLNISIAAVDPLQIVTTALPVAYPTRPYVMTLEVSGGLPPITWNVQGLPPGLSVTPLGDRTADLTGSTTSTGTWTVDVEVTDQLGTSTQRTLELLVSDLAIVTQTLAPASECQPYQTTIASNGNLGATYTWTATVPPGLTLSTSTGPSVTLSGTPLAAGPQTVAIAVDDGTAIASATLTLDVQISPDGGRWIAVVGDVVAGGDVGVHVADVCGGNVAPSTLVSPPATGFGDASTTATDQVRFAPGGRSIAFVGDFRVNGFTELFVAHLDPAGHGAAYRVSGDLVANGNVSDFRWSPDGTRLVYRADQDVDGQFELYAVDAAASSTTSVRVNAPFPAGGNVFTDDFEWSPDGRWIAFQADGTNDGDNEVFVADMLSGPPYLVYPANSPLGSGMDIQDDFEWLPSGVGLVFRGDMIADGVSEVFVVATTGAAPSAPSRVNGILGANGDVEVFAASPDGTAVAYIADEITNGTNELFVVPMQGVVPGAGGVVSAPLVAGGNVTSFRWSDDGTKILYTADGNLDEQFELFLVEGPAFAEPRVVSGTLDPAGDVRADTVDAPSFAFSPDGATAAFIADSAIDTAEALHVVTLSPAPVPMVTERFDDGDRTTATPPSSLSWVTTGAQSTLSVANGAMTLSTGGTSGRHAAAHFPPMTLAVGDRLRLEFDLVLTLPASLSNALRIGLFDTMGPPVVTSDGDNPDVVHGGYAVFTNPIPASANPMTIRRRDETTAVRLITTASAYDTIGSAGGPQQAFTDGVTYHASFTVHRTGADEVTLTMRFDGGAFNGYELTQTDTGIFSSFDGVVICLGSSSGTAGAFSITVDDVMITHEIGSAPPDMVAPIPGAGEGVHDFAFSPDGRWIAFRGSLGGTGATEAFAASTEAGASFLMGNVLHGLLPAGAAVSTAPSDFGWAPDSSRVIAVGDVATAGTTEAWALAPSGGSAPVRLNAPMVAGGNVAFTVIPR